MERRLTLGQRRYFLISFVYLSSQDSSKIGTEFFHQVLQALDSKNLAPNLESGMHKIYELESCHLESLRLSLHI